MPHLPSRFQFIFPGDKIHKIGAALSASSRRELYATLARSRGADVLLEPPRAHEDPWQSAYAPESLGFVEEMMLLDLTTYLPDDILTKVDRASMAVALEARVPLIDHRVVEFAWTLPTGFRIRNGVTKAPLRDLLGQFVPRALFERPKAGFGIPVGDWVRGPLREWAEGLLSPTRLRDGGILHPERVRALWDGHVDGKTNTGPAVWSVLMLQAWLAENRLARN
jgi:asparagine synthase (glutamine-hydrolysing)